VILESGPRHRDSTPRIGHTSLRADRLRPDRRQTGSYPETGLWEVTNDGYRRMIGYSDLIVEPQLPRGTWKQQTPRWKPDVDRDPKFLTESSPFYAAPNA
jgi:hypothetical protein